MSAVHWQKGNTDAVEPSSNVWFSVSLGLLGIIIGYSVGSWRLSGGLVPVVPPSAQGAAVSSVVRSLAPLKPVDIATEHIKGNKEADIALVEYSDFECPYCKRANPTYNQLVNDYDGTVMWVYRTYPLSSIHPHADQAAQASECVAELGGNDAFWKFEDAIFTNESPWERLGDLAQSVGVNKDAFTSCLSSGKYAQKVKDVQDAGLAAGADGTPTTFIINLRTKKSQTVVGAQPVENFKKAIDGLLQ